MSDREIKNATIKNATIGKAAIGYEGHGILSSMIFLDYGSGGQGFGGYALGGTEEGPSGHMELWITRILKVVGAEEWGDLVGKSVRVDASWGKVYRIGNFLKDEWFDPAAEFEAMRKKESPR